MQTKLDPIPETLVPDQVLGVHLSEEQKRVISLSHELPVKNIPTENGLKDGMVTFLLDKKDPGNPKLLHEVFFEDHHINIIPDMIGDKKVNKQALAQGEFDGPHSLAGIKDVFIRHDPSSNSIVFKTGRQLNIPIKISGYELSDNERLLLANGSKLKEALITKTKNGYVSYVPQIDRDKGLVQMHGVKLLTSAELNTYKSNQIKLIFAEEEVEKMLELKRKVKHLLTKPEAKVVDDHIAKALKQQTLDNNLGKAQAEKAGEELTKKDQSLKVDAEVSDLKRAVGNDKDNVAISAKTESDQLVTVQKEKIIEKPRQEETKVDEERIKVRERNIGLPKRKNQNFKR